MKTESWIKKNNGNLAGATVYKPNGETVMREGIKCLRFIWRFARLFVPLPSETQQN